MITNQIINAVDYVKSDPNSVLLHVCNTKNHFNVGIAKEIQIKIPKAFEVDTNFEVREDERLGLISSTIPVMLGHSVNVINMYAQLNYGKEKRQLHYGMLAKCLIAAKREILTTISLNRKNFNWNNDFKVLIPHRMGCINAGGDWKIVYELIEGILTDMNIIICKNK